MRLFNIALRNWLPSVFSISLFVASLRAESPIQAASSSVRIFRVPASRLQNRPSEQLSVDLRRGSMPDDAAAIAPSSTPALGAIRDHRRLPAAPLLPAALLP